MDEHSPAPAVVDAAWELQVELATRLGTRQGALSAGLPSEALAAVEAALAQARRTAAAPGTGRDAERLRSAAAELEAALAPVVDRWRPLLDAHEETRLVGVPLADHEATWPHAGALRAELETLSGPMRHISTALGDITGAELEPDPALGGAIHTA